jgi:hypothetical protein
VNLRVFSPTVLRHDSHIPQQVGVASRNDCVKQAVAHRHLRKDVSNQLAHRIVVTNTCEIIKCGPPAAEAPKNPGKGGLFEGAGGAEGGPVNARHL